MAKSTRLAAANLLLNRGVRFTIPDAPLLWRLFRFNRIHIKPLRAGTIIEISAVIDEHDLANSLSPSDINGKLEPVALIIAMAMLNSRKRITRFSARLGRLLLWKVPAKVLIEIFRHIAELNKVTDFTAITVFFCLQAKMMMSPKNTGQQDGGS